MSSDLQTSLKYSESRFAELKQSLNSVRDEIAQEVNQVGRSVDSVNLVAVSKYMPPSDIQALYDLGQRDFGENYVQELTHKAEILPKDIKWHFIGSLQTNKCKVLSGRIPNLYAVETVDSQAKAQKLNDTRGEFDTLNVYLQVNTSGEDQKSGLSDEAEIISIAKFIVDQCPKLNLLGLMTIGSFSASVSEGENQDFKKLIEVEAHVSEQINKKLGLSMGMSADYIEAIRQGSTNVRVGRTIFGSRPLKQDL
ncbi:similar to Saccharomyces cerevisiae YBL036C Putative non-specific single-domain racemase based on structural similarity [Geotrichum candidum]|uniref:Pyridoxal phosphate homeostasis protein n=1 Tax=Geotrichum candidum TaxID=1173061 RepID=A0A0J9XKF1_GEOCN|nr:similar to Saccharomyces cerevisiae YBL036C Putative non-specific single-domain racemase based on structural similarity [Geotrichum candidum]